MDKEYISYAATGCIFGKDGSGQALRKLPAYKAMEKPHDILHRTYIQIFKLQFGEPYVSVWGRLFGKAKK